MKVADLKVCGCCICNSSLSRIPLVLFVLFLFVGCGTLPVIREIKKVEEIATINRPNSYLKAHMKDGTLMIFSEWQWIKNSEKQSIIGQGVHLDINRRELKPTTDSMVSYTDGKMEIGMSNIVLVETNKPQKGTPAIVTVAAFVVGVAAIYCAIDPKACFGSCPTFYTINDGVLELQAEGFSSSIMPSLEKNDIDMLYKGGHDKAFELVVKNEAYETHYIRKADLLAIEKKADERVYVSPNGLFYRTVDPAAPSDCQSEMGSCLDGIKQVDGIEYFSEADKHDLNTREEIFVSFEVDAHKDIGLIIGKRQTLLTTYLLYQSLAYMGKGVSYWMAMYETNPVQNDIEIFNLLGGIEVFSKDKNGSWKFEGMINETGPIATDFNIIKLSNAENGKVDLKLVLNKGLWRIDYLGLATVQEAVEPIKIKPQSVKNIAGTEDHPLEKLTDEAAYLVTYPGDEYRLYYDVPFDEAELFLETKGYYIEWMRDVWVEEQDFSKVKLLFNNPSKYLKKETKPFKASEKGMEEIFWNSRYVKNN